MTIIGREQELIERYQAGEPWRSLEPAFGHCMAWLLRHLRKMGVAERNRLATQLAATGGKYQPWIFQRDELITLYCEGLDIDEIASRLNRTRDGVRHELARLGYPTYAVVAHELAVILEGDGFFRDEIHRLTGIKGYGRRRKSAARRPRTIDADDIQLIEYCLASGMTLRATSKILDISEFRLARIIREQNLFRPPRLRLRRSKIKDARARLLPDGMGGVA